jgi:hypothetical protein
MTGTHSPGYRNSPSATRNRKYIEAARGRARCDSPALSPVSPLPHTTAPASAFRVWL